MEAVLLDGTDNIVTRRALDDTVSSTVHVTRIPDCVTAVVMPVGVETNVTKVSSLLTTYNMLGKKQLLKTINCIHV